MLDLCWPTPNGRPPLKLVIGLAIVAVTLFATASLAEVSIAKIIHSGPRFCEFLQRVLVMPDWSYSKTLCQKMWETLELAFLGTSLALAGSVPLGFLAAKNTTLCRPVFHLARLLLGLMRALPELVWALIFVSAVGLGALPGILAITFVTIGFMGKFFAESLEVVDQRPVDGVAAHGASWFQLRLFAHLPQALPDFVGSSLYVLDSNLRSAAILGIVGVGGIGYDMVMAVRLFDYNRILMIIGAIYVLVTILDRLSDKFRKRMT